MLYQASNPHGGDLYGRAVDLDFSVNTNPLGTPPSVVRAVEDAARDLCPHHMVQEEVVSHTGPPAVAGRTLLTARILDIE